MEAIRQRRVPSFNTESEKVIYEFATQLHRDHRVNDETYAAAVNEFGEEGTVDLVGILGYYTLISMTLNAFKVLFQRGKAQSWINLSRVNYLTFCGIAMWWQ